MKKLKYLLITILFAAFAGEGFGQPTVNWTVTATPQNSGLISCNGTGGNVTIVSDFEINGNLYDPNAVNSIYNTGTVYIFGEKQTTNGIIRVGIGTSGNIYQFPVTDFEAGKSKTLVIPSGITQLYLCFGEGLDYSNVSPSNPNTSLQYSNHMYRFTVWNHVPNFKITTNDQTLCSTSPSVTIYSTFDSPSFSSSITTNSNMNHGHNITYNWSDGANNIGTGANLTVNPNVTTTYTLTAWVNGSCQASDQVTIYVYDNPIANGINYSTVCNGASGTNVTIDLVAYTGWVYYTSSAVLKKSGSSFLQGPVSSQTLTRTFANVPPGSGYYFETQTPCGTVNSNPFTIQTGTSPTASANIINPKCFGDKGSILISASGGNAPLSFNWYLLNTYTYYYDPIPIGGSNAFGLSPGTYQVDVVSSTGCLTTISGMVINAPLATAPLSVGTTTPMAATCLGVADGEIDISPISGGVSGYTVNWSNGASGTNITNLAGNTTYNFTVTDAEGCTLTGSRFVGNGSSGIISSSTITNETCTGIGDGEIGLLPNTYNYNWSNGTTGGNLSNLLAGNYTVTITDPGSGCQSVSTYTVSNNTASTWHKASNNPIEENDQVVKVLTNPATNDVYVLGEFKGQTEMDYLFDAGSPTQEGIFIIKYDECGKRVWGVHSEAPPQFVMKINALDLQFNGSSIRVYGQWDNVNQASFDMKSSAPIPLIATQPVSSLQTDNVFSLDIDASNGEIATSASIYELNYADKINQVIYEPSSSMSYFAGRFGNKAGVKSFNSSTFNSDELEDAKTDNEIKAITIIGTNLFAVANISNLIDGADFNSTPSGNIIPNGIQEAVILKKDLSNSSTPIDDLPASAQNYVSANDITDDGTNLWVAVEFDVELGNWSSLNSNINTAMIIKFDQSLHPLQSFFIDENNSYGLQQASANAISIVNNEIYVAGTFIGQDLTIGNGSFTTPNSMISGSTITSDLWMAKYDLNAGMFLWIEGSNSLEPVQVNDIEFDGRNAYLAGSFLDDIDFQNNVTNINHPHPQAFYSGYVIRGGDFLSSGGQGLYYKTGNSSTSTTKQATSLIDESALVVYPNPNNGTFTIKYNGESMGMVHIVIYDVTGRLVFNQEYDKTSTAFNQTISPMQFTTGIYMLGMEINGETQYQKFIVQ